MIRTVLWIAVLAGTSAILIAVVQQIDDGAVRWLVSIVGTAAIVLIALLVIDDSRRSRPPQPDDSSEEFEVIPFRQ